MLQLPIRLSLRTSKSRSTFEGRWLVYYCFFFLNHLAKATGNAQQSFAQAYLFRAVLVQGELNPGLFECFELLL